LKKHNFDVIIGTLGRISELIKEKVLEVHNVETLVLDEADKLFLRENEENTKKILLLTKNSRNYLQILAFSGTFNEKTLGKIRVLLDNFEEIFISSSLKRKAEYELDFPLKNPDLDYKDLNLSNIRQFYIRIPPKSEKLYQKKTEFLLKILEKINFSQCLVFYNEKARGEELSYDIKNRGFSVTFMHGDLSQSDRIKVMNRLSLQKINVIVATDLLSRGIDIESIDFVINYDMPKDLETYFHRIGRSSRFGRKGLAVSFIEEKCEEIGEKSEEICEKSEEICEKSEKCEEICEKSEEICEKTIIYGKCNEKAEKCEGKNKGKKKYQENSGFLKKFQGIVEIKEAFIEKLEELNGFLVKREEVNQGIHGVLFEEKREWKEIGEKVLEEEEFKYFEEDLGVISKKKSHEKPAKKKLGKNTENLSCLNCAICKEFLVKSSDFLGKIPLEILSFFRI